MSGPGALILLVEDEPQMRRFLRVSLEGSGYRYLEAATGQEGLSLAAQHRPDVLLLDLGLPDMDGLEVVSRLREWSQIPVIVISARGQESDKVDALDAGANDYLTKPFGTRELLARVRVALRHANPEAGEQPVFTLGRWRVDLAKRQVFVEDQEVHLTPLEYSLFTTLIRHAGKVVTHRQLLKEVWGGAAGAQPLYLRVYMTQLRHKLEEEPSRPRYLKTEPGVGYRLFLED
ncbi:DNA-binding response regulator [Geothrix limicola]|uniref:DNA-binding response regulator n=1 Tax=Geothrix limicola TaxID=2927978 RepID=A0ABQ5QHH4_9BACT|nr:response regulator [Geothrix limicola]GLH73499.1 DNA-binding response regulator [Geothrix limicola]